jgi:hypothetical protein
MNKKFDYEYFHGVGSNYPKEGIIDFELQFNVIDWLINHATALCWRSDVPLGNSYKLLLKEDLML